MLKFEDLDLSDRYNLINSLPKHYMNGVEIGVWEGWFTQHLVASTNMHIFAIDPFCETHSYEGGGWESNKGKPNFNPFEIMPSGDGHTYAETRYMATLLNLNRSFPHANRCTVIRSYSYDVKYFFIGTDLDFVYMRNFSSIISLKFKFFIITKFFF